MKIKKQVLLITSKRIWKGWRLLNKKSCKRLRKWKNNEKRQKGGRKNWKIWFLEKLKKTGRKRLRWICKKMISILLIPKQKLKAWGKLFKKNFQMKLNIKRSLLLWKSFIEIDMQLLLRLFLIKKRKRKNLKKKKNKKKKK